MHALILIIVTFVGYLIAYHTYGRYVAQKVFQIDPNAVAPSHALADGKDYIASKRQVMFGHHFTSIAGTGPIVGPAIGIIWGWLPAVLWVFFGSIFMGAVHDFSALIISMRNQGKSISEVTSRYISPRVRLLFFLIVFLAVWIVMAIFGLVVALIFARFPQAVLPVWFEIPIAVMMGLVVFKRGGLRLKRFTTLFVLLMYGSVLAGVYFPFHMPEFFGIPATGIWTIVLLGYAFFASVLPVDLLLQPRDYLNAWQLYVALAILMIGIVATSFTADLTITAPAIDLNPDGAPPIWPFLFITIACGAISGFHSLIASGTSSKQIDSEADAQFVGYGSMLIEAGLATLVIVAVTAGISLAYTTGSGETLTGLAAWKAHYGSWTSSTGLGSKLTAVVVGSSNLMAVLGISKAFGAAIMGVFIASFAGTTLDSSARIQRYIVTELLSESPVKKWVNKWSATGIAVVTAALLAFSSGADGKGALVLWPMFGAVNQLLAALALMVATMYLRTKGGLKFFITAIPCVIMLTITLWAALINQMHFFKGDNLLLTVINLSIVILAFLMVCETIYAFFMPNRVRYRQDSHSASLGTPK